MNNLAYTFFDNSSNEELSEIKISGAREHNLKNISLDIPRDKFVVITGLSGSGKSSLAFDTLYAEGQRRYVECLSPYAKQFLGIMKKPDVDVIEGLSPAISIEQKSVSHNPRSTVGTTTEVYDYLRLLFSKIGTQYCTECNIPVIKKNLDEIINEIKSTFSGKEILVLAPIVKGRKGQYKELINNLMGQGFTRIRLDGKIVKLSENLTIERYSIHDIELVVDKIFVSENSEKRLRDSVSLSIAKSDGVVMILEDDTNDSKYSLFSVNNSCPGCGKSYDAPAPNSFSFNSPYGACQKCQGIGEIEDFGIENLLKNPELSIIDGAVPAMLDPLIAKEFTYFVELCNELELAVDIPVNKLSPNQFEELFDGKKEFDLAKIKKSNIYIKANQFDYFRGVRGFFRFLLKAVGENNKINFASEFNSLITCPDCKGQRLRKESLFIKIQDYNITDLCNLNIIHLVSECSAIEQNFTDRQKAIAFTIIQEITTRSQFLINVGLSYLSLNRSVRTLSGGESQRIRLASQIGSQLVGVMYVLDEPSIGLHQHDNIKLIDSLKHLRDLGNTVIVVEHDKQMIEMSDYLIDIGPGAGIHGGEIILTGNPVDIINRKDMYLGYRNSVTAQYLTGEKSINIPNTRRTGNGNFIELNGAKGNNLKKVDLKLPLGLFVCITGMSGSGKSSLINDTLYPILSRHFNRKSTLVPLPYNSVSGLEHIDKIIEIDQQPIGRTPRSNPATYTGIFTLIRDFFAMLPESKIRGYKSGRFSFNVEGGRCAECQGAGIKKIEMNFLPDVYVTCDECNGKRYNTETLMVKYRDHSIADVLDMTVEEANEFFKDIPKLKKKISTLFEVGLGYITLGQQAPTLSGGEAQRVKLATELSKVSTGKTLYLLDEPTTGLHFEDVNVLLKLLDKLVDKGNTVVVIEHNLDVIKCADYIIDLGPEGGAEGGKIVAQGTPEKIVKSRLSTTGKYLKQELAVRNMSKS